MSSITTVVNILFFTSTHNNSYIITCIMYCLKVGIKIIFLIKNGILFTMSDDNNVDLGDILINDGKVINIASTIDSYDFSYQNLYYACRYHLREGIKMINAVKLCNVDQHISMQFFVDSKYD